MSGPTRDGTASREIKSFGTKGDGEKIIFPVLLTHKQDWQSYHLLLLPMKNNVAYTLQINQ